DHHVGDQVLAADRCGIYGACGAHAAQPVQSGQGLRSRCVYCIGRPQSPILPQMLQLSSWSRGWPDFCSNWPSHQKSPVGPTGLGPWAAASQTCLPICEALACPSLACLIVSPGTPQVRVLSSRLLINLASAPRKFLNSLQAS